MDQIMRLQITALKTDELPAGIDGSLVHKSLSDDVEDYQILFDASLSPKRTRRVLPFVLSGNLATQQRSRGK